MATVEGTAGQVALAFERGPDLSKTEVVTKVDNSSAGARTDELKDKWTGGSGLPLC